MKGILLAGGAGTRLRPLTDVVGKALLPVYDKPMVYYPLTVLMLAGIREILVISTPRDLPMLRDLLGSGTRWGLALDYAEQAAPRGIADALLLAEPWAGDDGVCLILGDNLFHGDRFGAVLARAAARQEGATVFGYRVRNPQDYGVLDLGPAGVRAIVEKPADPPSRFAVPGLYFYDRRCFGFARALEPSPRGELEITDVNRRYLAEGALHVELLGRGVAWLDVGSHDSLLAAARFVEVLEARQGLKTACPEEVAWRLGWIDDAALAALAAPLSASGYGRYLRSLLEERR